MTVRMTEKEMAVNKLGLGLGVKTKCCFCIKAHARDHRCPETGMFVAADPGGHSRWTDGYWQTILSGAVPIADATAHALEARRLPLAVRISLLTAGSRIGFGELVDMAADYDGAGIREAVRLMSYVRGAEDKGLLVAAKAAARKTSEMVQQDHMEAVCLVALRKWNALADVIAIDPAGEAYKYVRAWDREPDVHEWLGVPREPYVCPPGALAALAGDTHRSQSDTVEMALKIIGKSHGWTAEELALAVRSDPFCDAIESPWVAEMIRHELRRRGFEAPPELAEPEPGTAAWNKDLWSESRSAAYAGGEEDQWRINNAVIRQLSPESLVDYAKEVGDGRLGAADQTLTWSEASARGGPAADKVLVRTERVPVALRRKTLLALKPEPGVRAMDALRNALNTFASGGLADWNAKLAQTGIGPEAMAKLREFADAALASEELDFGHPDNAIQHSISRPLQELLGPEGSEHCMEARRRHEAAKAKKGIKG